MTTLRGLLALLATSTLVAAAGLETVDWKVAAQHLAGEPLGQPFASLRPLHDPIEDPAPGDWLAEHEERGQSVRAYMQSNPIRPNRRWTTIYIQLIGDFTPEQRQIVELTAEYMALFFSTPVKVAAPLSIDVIPERAQRVHPQWGIKQLLTEYILDDVLARQRPEDAVAYIAFTATDLWPGRGWNFVFGSASLRDRVGVWSIYRNGDPTGSERMYKLCLLRTIKTAVHETGHILSIHHCITWQCIMNGSNHRAEADSRPLGLCPADLQKLCASVKTEPLPRYRKLHAFCETHHLEPEAQRFAKLIAGLKQVEL